MITVQNKKWTGGTEAWAFPGGVLNNSPDGHMVTCCHLPPHSASVSSPLTQFLSLRKKSLVFDLSPQETLQENESSEGGGGSESHSVMSDSLRPHGLYSPWNSPGQNTGVGSCSLLQGLFSLWELLFLGCVHICKLVTEDTFPKIAHLYPLLSNSSLHIALGLFSQTY